MVAICKGVYYHPSRAQKSCNKTQEFLQIQFRLLVVSHPLTNLIENFQKLENGANFADFVTAKLENFDILPSYFGCSICCEDLAPNKIVKMETFQQDLGEIFPQVLPVKNQNILKYVQQLKHEARLELFEFFRSQYELFGYDPFLDLLNF